MDPDVTSWRKKPPPRRKMGTPGQAGVLPSQFQPGAFGSQPPGSSTAPTPRKQPAMEDFNFPPPKKRIDVNTPGGGKGPRQPPKAKSKQQTNAEARRRAARKGSRAV